MRVWEVQGEVFSDESVDSLCFVGREVFPPAADLLEQALSSIATKLDRIPFDQIAADARRALASLDETLTSADVLVKRLDTEVAPEARRTLEGARRTLSSAERTLAADAPLQTDLRETLRELGRAAQSLRTLTESLERNPESLIRGKPAEAAP